jgi:transcriptional regulator with XRE-family HTH domain
MEEFTPHEIAKSLHLLRHAKGWTLRQLERESGIAVNTICAYKSRRRRAPLAAVERLLVAMGCTWESLDLARALLREVGGALDDERSAARVPPAGPEGAAAAALKLVEDAGRQLGRCLALMEMRRKAQR